MEAASVCFCLLGPTASVTIFDRNTHPVWLEDNYLPTQLWWEVKSGGLWGAMAKGHPLSGHPLP
jgi:hypothetical protein